MLPMMTVDNEGYWTGARNYDDNTLQRYEWIGTGTDLTSQSDLWIDNQFIKSTCAALYKQTARLSDEQCFEANYFICESHAVSTS